MQCVLLQVSDINIGVTPLHTAAKSPKFAVISAD